MDSDTREHPVNPSWGGGIRGRQPRDPGCRDWRSAGVTSRSLPLPPLLSRPSLSPLLSSLPPLPFLSIPPLGDGVCRCCSGIWGLVCTDCIPFQLVYPRFRGGGAASFITRAAL
ncbi:hypothetical protein FQA47_014752 [Oryzias melastigma]|uniref:Uncharacterized protein n=1 Tax=Oryzias melastigma TaxID=30732 RepID=A0A834EZQ2_ORYME|nr:hypothetical protein FQA47_014752 [Oryzias melastigma]